ncbi:MAG: hypothetical protein LBJ88_02735 [Campylobacteraceae bacterium]|jgi:hypothetical protein|nr:hypothetical protein [Campylobacteraceae bacterium]
MDKNQRYTLSIKVALPGTPFLKETGEFDTDNKTKEIKTSQAGHMWYSISDGENSVSYGFFSVNKGPMGPGDISTEDDAQYYKPYYTRTIEITKEQYDQLNTYGKSTKEEENPNFEMSYNGLSNSCIDFTWKALNSAGIQHREDNEFDGNLKPANNIDNIKSITAPFPNSELNSEKRNEKPSRNIWQWFLSQNESNELTIDQAGVLMNMDISYEELMEIGEHLDPIKVAEYIKEDLDQIKLAQIESENKKQNDNKKEEEDDNIHYHHT